MSQNHDDKKKKTSPVMEAANARPRSRRPDMQLYVPRAMRRDSLETNNASGDKAACIDNPSDINLLQRNADAADNKKSRSKKLAVSNDQPNNNTIGDCVQRKRMQRSSPKNGNGQLTEQNPCNPVAHEIADTPARKDDKVKKSGKKTKRNVKSVLSAAAPSYGEVNLLSVASDDLEQAPCIPETGVNNDDAPCVTNAESADLVLMAVEPHPISETSQMVTSPCPPTETGECSQVRTAEHNASLSMQETSVEYVGSESETLPVADAKYVSESMQDELQEPFEETVQNELQEPVDETATHESETNLPVLRSAHNVFSIDDLHDAAALHSDGCSTSLKTLIAGVGCANAFASDSLDFDVSGQVDENLTDQVKLLSSCNVSQLTKLGCENIELFLKESAGLIAELENASLEHRSRVSSATDSDTNASNPLIKKELVDDDVILCESPKSNDIVVKVKDLVPPKEILPSSASPLSWNELELSQCVCTDSDPISSIERNSLSSDIATVVENTSSVYPLLATVSEYVLEKTNNTVIPEREVLRPLENLNIISAELNDDSIVDPIVNDSTLVNKSTYTDAGPAESVLKSADDSSDLPSEMIIRHTKNNVNPLEELSCYSKSCQTTDHTAFKSDSSDDCVNDSAPLVTLSPSAKDKISSDDESVQVYEKQSCNESNPHLIEPDDVTMGFGTISPTKGISTSDADVSLENSDDSWEAMYDETGECLNPDLMKELTVTVGKKIKVQRPKIDYTKFQPKEPQISDNEFGHVIEIYDFPVEFKTQDLMAGFAQFQNRGFDIKWVDDTHALGLFASPMAAADALKDFNPMFKTRPLSQATRESKVKAKRCAEFLQPYRPRPETSASLARRLVSGALGLQVRIPKEVRELERQKLREAKEKRKLAAKQKVDVWEGVVTNGP